MYSRSLQRSLQNRRIDMKSEETTEGVRVKCHYYHHHDGNQYTILTCALKGIREISQGVGWCCVSGLEGANVKIDMRGLAGLGGRRPKMI